MDEKQFIEYIKQYKDEFYRFLKRNLINSSSIEDVFSDTIITAYEKRNEFQDGSNFKAWMYKILLNKCYVYNREHFNFFEPLDGYEDIPSPNHIWKTGDIQIDFEKFLESCSDEVYKAFIKLPPLQRFCIYLKDIENFSYKEIAEILNIPTPSVMTYLSRGRANLRKNLLQQVEKNNEKSLHIFKFENISQQKNTISLQRSKINVTP